LTLLMQITVQMLVTEEPPLMTDTEAPAPGLHAAHVRLGNGQPAPSLIRPAARHPRQPAQSPEPDLREAGIRVG
jgi:hypothetical protein